MKTTAQKDSIRHALLAKIHIAKKALGLDEELYRLILREEFPRFEWGAKGPSSADLPNALLAQLVARFEAKGWKPRSQRSEVGGQRSEKKSQADALKEKVGQVLLHTDFDEVRLRGLVRRICGVEDLRWCSDAVRLKSLLAAIGRMMDRGDIQIVRNAECGVRREE